MDEMMEMMRGMEFPATKQEIMDMAREKNMSGDAMDMVRNLPDREYESMDDLKSEMGM